MAAAASVLNVGVSIVGFAMTLHKLDRLQRSVDQLSRAVDRGFVKLHEALQGLESQLVASVAAIRGDLAPVREDIQRLHRDLHEREVSKVRGLCELIERTRSRDRTDALDALRHVEREVLDVISWLETHVASDPRDRMGQVSLDHVAFTQAYCTAAQLEATARFHLDSPVQAALQLKHRLAAVEDRLVEASVLAAPMETVHGERLEDAEAWLGPAPISDLRDLQRNAPLAGIRVEPLGTESLRPRILVATSYAMTMGRLRIQVEEFESGDPDVVDPLAIWEAEQGEQAAVLVSPAKWMGQAA